MRLFDTTFLIDLVNEDRGAVGLAEKVDLENSFRAVSVVTVYEYLLGVHSVYYNNAKLLREKLESANRDLSPFEILPLTNEIARESSKLQASLQRRGRMLGLNDLYIASTASNLKLSLVTRNTDDFKKVPDLNIESY